MFAFSLTGLLFSLILGGLGGLGTPYIPQPGASAAMLVNNMLSPEPVSETVRSYFPETWIWELAVVE